MRALPTFAKVNVTPEGHNLLVFLDGVEQHGVVECDTEAGYLVRYVTESSPDQPLGFRLLVVNGDAVTERVEGVVTLAWRDDA